MRTQLSSVTKHACLRKLCRYPARCWPKIDGHSLACVRRPFLAVELSGSAVSVRASSAVASCSSAPVSSSSCSDRQISADGLLRGAMQIGEGAQLTHQPYVDDGLHRGLHVASTSARNPRWSWRHANVGRALRAAHMIQDRTRLHRSRWSTASTNPGGSASPYRAVRSMRPTGMNALIVAVRMGAIPALSSLRAI